METQDRLSRFGPLAGVAFVVLQFVAVAIGSQQMVTISDSTSKITRELTKHVSTGAWIGSYLELTSLAAFAVFAAWLFRGRRGTAGTAGLLAAAAYISLIAASGVVSDVIKFGAHHGLSDQSVLALFYLQSGLFIASWAATAAFLALAPVDGWLRRSAQVLAGLCCVAVAAPKAGWAQFPPTASYLWILVAGVVLALGSRSSEVRGGAAAHAAV